MSKDITETILESLRCLVATVEVQNATIRDIREILKLNQQVCERLNKRLSKLESRVDNSVEYPSWK